MLLERKFLALLFGGEKMNKTRYFLFPYMAIKNREYIYGRQLFTVVGHLSIPQVEDYIKMVKGVTNVIITGIFEMSEDDYLASNLIE